LCAEEEVKSGAVIDHSVTEIVCYSSTEISKLNIIALAHTSCSLFYFCWHAKLMTNEYLPSIAQHILKKENCLYKI
jgi:hypothetical protein